MSVCDAMPKHVQTRSVSDFQWPLRHDVVSMEGYHYLAKNIGITSMENVQKLPEKRLKK
jgi:hypothetical protein